MKPELHRHRRHLATSTVLVVAAVAAAVATGPAAAQSPAGTRITQIRVEHPDEGSTVISVSFDGPIAGRRWFHIDGDEPRAVVRIAGIVEAYRPYEVAVDDGRIHRVRIGHHPEFNPPEEHLVFDLIDDEVAVTRVTTQDRRLTVVLQRVGASGDSLPPRQATPTPTELVPKPVPATATPTARPTATATIASPTPSTSADPTATPASPTPPEPPRAALPTRPPTPSQGAAPDRRGTTDPHPHGSFSGPLLTELVISYRVDGSALVRVTANGPIERSDVRFFGVRLPPPRNLLVITGVGLPGEDALLPVRDGLLCDIGVAFIQDGGPARTELMFHLASSEVTFAQAAVKGPHAVILLLPPRNPQERLGCEVESRMQGRTWRFAPTGTFQEAPNGTE